MFFVGKCDDNQFFHDIFVVASIINQHGRSYGGQCPTLKSQCPT